MTVRYRFAARRPPNDAYADAFARDRAGISLLRNRRSGAPGEHRRPGRRVHAALGLGGDRDRVAAGHRGGEGQRRDPPLVGETRPDRRVAPDDPGLPGLARGRGRQVEDQVRRGAVRRDDEGSARTIAGRRGERHDLRADGAGDGRGVAIRVAARAAVAEERDHEHRCERERNGERHRAAQVAAQCGQPAWPRTAPGRTADDRGAKTRRRIAPLRFGDGPGRLGERPQLGAAAWTGLQVRIDGAALVRIQRAERVRREVVERMVRHGIAISIRSPARSLAMPRRTRLFTVPSGVPVRSAISRCERPDQNARLNTTRCSSGSAAIAARTRSARRLAMTRSSTWVSSTSSAASSIAASRSTRRPFVRRQSIAALRAIASSHVRTEPRSARYDLARRQTAWNASWATSSAGAGAPSIRYRTPNTVRPWRS